MRSLTQNAGLTTQKFLGPVECESETEQEETQDEIMPSIEQSYQESRLVSAQRSPERQEEPEQKEMTVIQEDPEESKMQSKSLADYTRSKEQASHSPIKIEAQPSLDPSSQDISGYVAQNISCFAKEQRAAETQWSPRETSEKLSDVGDENIFNKIANEAASEVYTVTEKAKSEVYAVTTQR